MIEFVPSSTLAGLILLFTLGCSSNGDDASSNSETAGTQVGASGSNAGSGDNGGTNDTSGSSGAGGTMVMSGGSGHGGSAGTGGSSKGGGGSGGSGGSPLPPATGTPGKWQNVTSPAMDPALFTGSSGGGVGNIVQDPHRPTDMYAGGYGSIWKSVDYGLTWKEVPSKPVPAYEPLGHVLAVGGDGDKATLWMANGYGDKKVYRSTDAGLTFTLTGSLGGGGDASLYSIVVDPNDSKHLISGFHEQDGVAESTDSGDTWHYAGKTGWPGGGVSWFPFFIDMGDAAKTGKTWLAIAQNGGSVTRTTDAGLTWSTPNGIAGLQHPHGNAGLYQEGGTIFIGGMQGVGDGIYRSKDFGVTWTRVDTHGVGVVWGTPKNLYAMWAWACASCKWDNPVQSLTAPQPWDELDERDVRIDQWVELGREQRGGDVRRDARRVRRSDVGIGTLALRRALSHVGRLQQIDMARRLGHLVTMRQSPDVRFDA